MIKSFTNYLLGNSSQLFTSMLYNNYAPPPGFCFDVLCDDDPIINDKRSPDYNVDAKVSIFHYYTAKLSSLFIAAFTDNFCLISIKYFTIIIMGVGCSNCLFCTRTVKVLRNK